MPKIENGISNFLIDHYQKTYELTYEFWKQRNNTFLFLLAFIALGTITTFGGTETNSLLVDFVAKAFGVTDTNRINEIRSGFPFSLLQSTILIVVFYLMVNLYHRSIYVLRNFKYIAALENEIRENLEINEEKIFFTRESKFYWSARPRLLSITKWFYIFLLGSLLLTFLFGRVYNDINIKNYYLAIVEGVVSIFILIYFGGYAFQSVKLDSKKE